MDKELGVAIWGAGWVTTEHLRGWIDNPHSRVVAMGSRRAEQVRERLSEAGIQDDADVYTSLDEILERKDIDAISICLPSHLQAEAAIKSAAAGKHLFIEKPMAMTLEELRQVRDAVRKARVKTVVGFVLRWNPLIQIAKNLVADGSLGKIIYGRFGYLHEAGPWHSAWEWMRKLETGGTVTLLGGCHAIDTMRYLMGQEVAEVTAFSTRGHRTDFEYEPTLAGLIRFEDGALAHLTASQEIHMPYVFPVELMGSLGALRDGKLWSEKLKGQTDWVPIPTVLPDSGHVAHHPFKDEIDHLVDCVLNDQESHVSAEDAVKTHEVVFALDTSAEKGGAPVRLPLLDQ